MSVGGLSAPLPNPESGLVRSSIELSNVRRRRRLAPATSPGHPRQRRRVTRHGASAPPIGDDIFVDIALDDVANLNSDVRAHHSLSPSSPSPGLGIRRAASRQARPAGIADAASYARSPFSTTRIQQHRST
jgi:hypothetical protein